MHLQGTGYQRSSIGASTATSGSEMMYRCVNQCQTSSRSIGILTVTCHLKSRRQHETGLKHQGNKERFIRELYKGGDRVKREKLAEAADMARIESVSSIVTAYQPLVHDKYEG